MRRAIVPGLVGILLAACAGDEPEVITGPEAGPSPSPTVEQSPGDLPGSTCEQIEGGNRGALPEFVDAEVDSSGGIDSMTFRFRHPDPYGGSGVPYHVVRFTDELLTSGEGAAVEVEGEAFLQVTFQAMGVDLSGEDFEEIYEGPKEFTPGFPTLVEAEHLGEFEATIDWGLGLSRMACPRVTAKATELTIEFASG